MFRIWLKKGIFWHVTFYFPLQTSDVFCRMRGTDAQKRSMRISRSAARGNCKVVIMQKIFFVGLGGFVGAILRYLLGYLFAFISFGFPLGTLGVNFIGAFLIGAVTEIAVGSVPLHPNLLLFLTVGLCGGFTTFSTFSLETVQLFEKGRTGAAFLYIGVSVAACLVGVLLAKLAVQKFVG